MNFRMEARHECHQWNSVPVGGEIKSRSPDSQAATVFEEKNRRLR